MASHWVIASSVAGLRGVVKAVSPSAYAFIAPDLMPFSSIPASAFCWLLRMGALFRSYTCISRHTRFFQSMSASLMGAHGMVWVGGGVSLFFCAEAGLKKGVSMAATKIQRYIFIDEVL